MARRYRIKGHYVIRDMHGRFKRWTSVGRSTASDRRIKAKRKLSRRKPGYGYLGDYLGTRF